MQYNEFTVLVQFVVWFIDTIFVINVFFDDFTKCVIDQIFHIIIICFAFSIQKRGRKTIYRFNMFCILLLFSCVYIYIFVNILVANIVVLSSKHQFTVWVLFRVGGVCMLLIFIIYHLKIRILLQTKIFSFDRKTVSVKRSKVFCFDRCVPSTVCDSVAIYGNQTINRFKIRCFMTRLYRNFSLFQFALCLKIAHSK